MTPLTRHRHNASLALLLSLLFFFAITSAQAGNPPVANASKSSNLSGVAPLNVNFDASLSTCDGGCSNYILSSSDNVILTSGVKTNEIVQVAGTHLVTLLVIDAQGLRSTANLTVKVTASSNPPVANASSSSNLKGAAPLTAQFGDLSTCDNTCSNATWSFGDGTTGTSFSGSGISHVYSNPGTYTATLTATDAVNGKKASTTVKVLVVPSESLSTYVQACQAQLNFQNINIPNMNCLDGDLFDVRTPKNDYLVYKKITDQVDAAVACRWVSGNDRINGLAVSIEMLIYNRQLNNACFFSANNKVFTSSVSVKIVSPTDPAASSFWQQPADVDAHVRCIGCHVEGPYIATPLIAPFLAKNGLMNNGHDTGSNIVAGDFKSFNASHVKYHAVSAAINNIPNTGAFSLWDSLKQSYMDPSESNCSLGCHVIGTLSPQASIDIPPAGNVLFNPQIQLQEIDDASVMAPYNDGSDYRWINLSIPDGGTENETFATAKSANTTLVPTLLGNCAAPGLMYAHVVGSDNQFVVSQPGRFTFLPDRLSVFNLKDGLVCLNSDQDAGQPPCTDYTVQYECTNNTTNAKTWTNLPNHTPLSDGDHEPRPANVCPGGSTATGIQAFFTLSNGWTYSAIGPNDRLDAMSQYGITCSNVSQPDNKCSNYVVSYSNCGAAPSTQNNKTLTNENTTAGSKQLTAASSSLTKGQSHNGGTSTQWNTQQWSIEPIANTEYVRLHNVPNNLYLTVSSMTDQATVGTAGPNTTINEMWLIEPVSNSSYVRLKNLFSGRYLTMGDPNSFKSTPDYIPIYSQARNTGWNTQRWLIQ